MERTFLEELDLGDGAKLPKAAIDAIMAQNGKDINAAKGDLAAVQKALKEAQDAAARGDPAALEAANAKVRELQEQLDEKNKAEKIREIRTKVSEATGVNADLLTGETEEDCTAQAKAILEWHTKNTTPPAAPYLPNPGEPNGVGGTPGADAAWAGLSASLR